MTFDCRPRKPTKYRIGAAIFFATLCSSTIGWPWGGNIHSLINNQATIHLPASMSNVAANAGFLGAHASDADFRKRTDPVEAPRHYMDIDNFSGFFDGTLPHDLDSLITEYGGQIDVIQNGILPFAIEQFTDSLTHTMAAGKWDEVLLVAADLGHYVADAHQPLHCTRNYNGQFTGNDGIHGRYETEMTNRRLGEISLTPARVTYVSSPVDFAFEIITAGWSLVDSILTADNIARTESGHVFDEVYYDALWRETGDMTRARIQKATEALASLWYTAWVDAGRPPIPADLFSMPIAKARADRDRDFIPDLSDSVVTVAGVITSPDFAGGSSSLHFLQDFTAGMAMYAAGSISPPVLNIGDSVKVTGVIRQYNGLTEIQPQGSGDIQILGTGRVPRPQVIAASVLDDTVGETIEGLLAVMENVAIVPGEVFPALGRFGIVRAIDALGDTARVFIDNDTDIDGTETPGGHLTITGLISQYDPDFPPDAGYQLQPRALADIVPYHAGKLGDLNDDGNCNSTDALLILSYDVGLTIPQEPLARINAGLGDLNSDVLTNSTDALILLAFGAGQPVPFPVCQPLTP